MPFGAIALELLTGGKNLAKMGFSAVGGFLGKLDAQGVAGLLVSLALAFLSFHQWGEARHWRKQSNRFEALYTSTKTAFDQTVANYRTAADRAAAADKAKAERVKVQQDQISQEQSDEYEARVAAARAEYERLRASSVSHSGSSSGAAVLGLPPPAGGSAEASGEDGFPSDDAFLCTAQSLQLDELIKWATRQHSIDPNKDSQ